MKIKIKIIKNILFIMSYGQNFLDQPLPDSAPKPD